MVRYWYSPDFLRERKPAKNCGVAFGGHAAGVVASDVAGHAVRQKAFSPVSETHSPIIPAKFDPASGRGQNSASYESPIPGG
jgi:hypothetical protein